MNKFSTLSFPILSALTERMDIGKSQRTPSLKVKIEGWYFGSVRNFLASLTLKFFLWRSVLRIELSEWIPLVLKERPIEPKQTQ